MFKIRSMITIAMLLLIYMIWQKNQPLAIILIVFFLCFKLLSRAKSATRLLARGLEKTQQQINTLNEHMEPLRSIAYSVQSLRYAMAGKGPEEMFEEHDIEIMAAEAEFEHTAL